MGRFKSFSHSRDEARRVLRDRLGRALRPALQSPAFRRTPTSYVTDVELLELLVRVHIHRGDNENDVRAAYEAHRTTHPESPTFDSLINEGWFGVTWGRVVSDPNTRFSANQQIEPIRTGFQTILNALLRETKFEFDSVSDLSQAVQEFAVQLAKKPQNVVSAPSPDWIAARLWERRSKSLSDKEALRQWMDRWTLLGCPIMSPTTWWTKDDARAWRRAAIDVLRHDPGLVKWDREKALIDARVNRERGRDWQSPEIPATLVERYLWVNSKYWDYGARALGYCGDTWALMVMLCEDLAAHDQLLGEPSAAEFLDLVSERPTLLVLLVERIRKQPLFLADLLLHPATCPLACLIVANWTAQSVGSWSRALQEAENEEARDRAFADAMAIATQHLRNENVPIKELAALLVWMHDRVRADDMAWSRRPRRISERMFEVVRNELLTLSRQQLEEMLAALSFRESDGLGTPRFTAALDVATFASLTEAIDSDKAVVVYVATFRPEAIIPDYIALTPAQAASLVLAARRSNAWNTFLAPFDVRERLEKPKEKDKNEYAVRYEIARALRAHIRVLSRAVAAWDGSPPDDLIKALASAIRSGSNDHTEKARVSAFTAWFEAYVVSHVEPQLVDDVAAACRRLHDATSRGEIEEALMLIDEPMAMARLLQRAPPAMRQKVSARIGALGPNDAAVIHSLPEIQGRIDELLNAGAIEASVIPTAIKYMNVERDQETLGRVADRAEVRLRFELRLALLQKNFSRIAKMTVPEGLRDTQVTAAQDTIDFFKGLAELSNPSGSASTAEDLFANLARRHPENAAYVVNQFAAYLARLLGDDMFRTLDIADFPAARSVMETADRALKSALNVGNDDHAIHESNKALLLLAMGKPREAYDILQHANAYGEREAVAAYGAVALDRMGRADEAYAILDRAEDAHKESIVLKAARKHLEGSAPARVRPLGVSDDNRVVTVQSALFRLQQMAPNDQARVFDRTEEEHVTNEIRSAAAGLTALVPMLRPEDDVTSVLLQILDARVRHLGWSVSDQSRGGYSAKGNPGERDLVLKHKDSYDLAVIEAAICKSNPSTGTVRKDLTSHFQKLFGYSQCKLFFLVVYSYVDRPQDVLATMREIGKSSAPPDFTCLHMGNDFPHDDSRPIGFEATYQVQDGRQAKTVVFLVINMLQQAQRNAAALAGKTSESKSRIQ
ncbi:MAG: tetratricopeptide repeat protein [Polyangiaceae bacterium]|nr:tetratricopeptide repeat protein [Polyangiaceae bacterium]